MPADHTCDGSGASPPLNWINAPAGTRSFAVLMSTLPGDGTTKYNWVLYNIPSTRTALPRANFGTGQPGVGSDGPAVAYQPPCSQGPGNKTYTFTVYALSTAPVSTPPAATPDGATLLASISSSVLAKATLNAGYSRSATSTGSSVGCGWIRNSVQAANSTSAITGCDSNYAYIASDGMPSHSTMDGITATNLQVPTAQPFLGTNAWRIPLNPALAAAPTSVIDGPVGVAVNGVPIFNPCKQGGCQNGDTKALGELDICNGHAGRADDYHYHAAPVCLMATRAASYWDTHPVGWALDGFAIYGYNDADGQPAARDTVCGGNSKPVSNGPTGYKYHVTDTSPYVMSCLRGVPSPDLVNQSAKYSPMRQPPVTPFTVAGMTLRTDSASAQQVLQFTSARTFTSTETGTDSYTNGPGTYQVRYRRLAGETLEAALAAQTNKSRTACWEFQFTNSSGAATQPAVTYCR